jgi:hypothetical protein
MSSATTHEPTPDTARPASGGSGAGGTGSSNAVHRVLGGRSFTDQSALLAPVQGKARKVQRKESAAPAGVESEELGQSIPAEDAVSTPDGAPGTKTAGKDDAKRSASSRRAAPPGTRSRPRGRRSRAC